MKNVKKKYGITAFGILCFMVMIFTYVNPNIAKAEVDKLKVATYAQDLEILDIDPKATGKSIIAAKDLYFKTFTEQDSLDTRDAAFLVFEKFYSKIAKNIYADEIFEPLYSIPYVDKDPYFLTAKKAAESYGFQLVQLEGDYQPVTDSNYLVKTFAKFVSPTIRAYLTFMKENENIAEDAALKVSLEELREIIILGDTVIKKFPQGDIASLIKPQINNLLYLYIFGIDNSLAYDSSSKKIRPELKNSLSVFLKENKDSTYYPFIKYVYDYLQKNNFTYTDTVRKALFKKLKEMEN